MELLNIIFIGLAILAMPLAKPEDLTGRVSYGFFSAIGNGLKSIGRAALPIVGGVLGGPVGAAAGSAVSGLLGSNDGTTAGKIGSVASAALPAIGALKASGQGKADAAMSRQLTEQAAAMAQANAQRATQEFELGSPLRQQFRAGAMSFGDPTNPFSQTMRGGMAGQEVPPEILERVNASLSSVADAFANKNGSKTTRKPKPSGGIAAAAQGME